MESPFLILPIAGFTPQIGRLVTMLRYARKTTLDAVLGLSMTQLDYLVTSDSNSIAMLLAHIVAVERVCQIDSFEERELNEAEYREVRGALEMQALGRREIRGHELAYYVAQLESARADTLRELATRNDRWLEEPNTFRGGLPTNNYFLWFHVLEDEIHHRGQIRWLRRRLPPQAHTAAALE